MIAKFNYEIPQIVSNGKACKTNENPDFFLTGTDIYAPMHAGNKVKFFTTGEDYFDRVGKAIDAAKHTVFITGWQINYDIQLRKVDTQATTDLITKRDNLQAELNENQEELDAYNKSLVNNPGNRTYKETFGSLNKARRIRNLQERIDEYNADIAKTRKEQTLWHCLRKAVLRGVKVYVLPWSCPPVGPVVTFDIETMCAIYQLNIGLPEHRAFFMFSSAKSDLAQQVSEDGKLTVNEALKNFGSLFFSHHQKSVIIDNEIGFVGGIDLAYGRRDNAEFRLNCKNRIGNDRYNPCIPPIRPAYSDEHVNRIALLLSTIFDISAPARVYNSIMGPINVFQRINYWFTSTYSWKIAYAFRNIKHAFNESTENIQEWALKTFFDPILGWVMTLGIDLTVFIIDIYQQEIAGYVSSLASKIGSDQSATIASILDKANKNQKLEYEDYINLIPALRNWYTKTPEGQLFSSLMDQDISFMLPEEDAEATGNFFGALIAQLFAALQQNLSNLEKPYYFLDEKPQPLLPRSGKILDANIQPRMPWHDVHMENQGPAVYDLSRNFIDRWNAGQIFVDQASRQPLATYKKQFEGLLKFIEVIFAKTEKLDNVLSLIPIYRKAKQQARLASNRFGERFKNAEPKPQFINISTLKQLPIHPDQTIHKGNDLVQIIRSAPKHLLQYEANARKVSSLYLDNYLTAKQISKPTTDSSGDKNNTSQVEQTTQQTPTNEQSILQGDNRTTEDVMKYIERGFDAYFEERRQLYELNVQFTEPKEIGRTDTCQSDCEQAWVKAITSAQHFIYIENQFFQSDFGEPFGYPGSGEPVNFNTFNDIPSGPMSSLVYFDEEILPIMKYIGVLEVLKTLDIRVFELDKFRDVLYALAGSKKGATVPKDVVKEKNPRLILKLKEQLSSVFMSRFSGEVTKRIFEEQEDPTRPQTNKIVQTLVERIKKAIYCGEKFHVYIVLPVHPEGMLNSDSVMHMTHMAMQTIYGGEKSIVKQIQKYMCIKRLVSEGTPVELAEADALALTGPNNDPLYTIEDWTDYLTLLNLRTWEKLGSFWKGKRVVTEQIYIHSKLMIVDDRVAIIGSCNINDRSMSGERDSEIAAIVRGGEEKLIPIDGECNQVVSETVHNFRVKLWRKHFALDIEHDFIDPAKDLAKILDKPAALTTAKAIQKIAKLNTDRYNAVFPFIPQNDSPVQGKKKDYPAQIFKGNYPKLDITPRYYPLGCSIWPQWAYNDPDNQALGGKLIGQMPFQQEFWDNALVPYKTPEIIQGFITELPIYWTRGEGNISNTAQAVIAATDPKIIDFNKENDYRDIGIAAIPTKPTDTRQT